MPSRTGFPNMPVEVVTPRVQALRLMVRFGRTAAIVVAVILLLMTLAALLSGSSVLPVVALLVAAAVVPFLLWLGAEICELLYDTLVPK